MESKQMISNKTNAYKNRRTVLVGSLATLGYASACLASGEVLTYHIGPALIPRLPKDEGLDPSLPFSGRATFSGQELWRRLRKIIDADAQELTAELTQGALEMKFPENERNIPNEYREALRGRDWFMTVRWKSFSPTPRRTLDIFWGAKTFGPPEGLSHMRFSPDIEDYLRVNGWEKGTRTAHMPLNLKTFHKKNAAYVAFSVFDNIVISVEVVRPI
jgi:hypothetical protein